MPAELDLSALLVWTVGLPGVKGICPYCGSGEQLTIGLGLLTPEPRPARCAGCRRDYTEPPRIKPEIPLDLGDWPLGPPEKPEPPAPGACAVCGYPRWKGSCINMGCETQFKPLILAGPGSF